MPEGSRLARWGDMALGRKREKHNRTRASSGGSGVCGGDMHTHQKASHRGPGPSGDKRHVRLTNGIILPTLLEQSGQLATNQRPPGSPGRLNLRNFRCCHHQRRLTNSNKPRLLSLQTCQIGTTTIPKKASPKRDKFWP